ncbi:MULTISPECIES: type II toxin-antitoxin system Phd/YefM family antitoxin, partial [unclassified Phaeobacter]|uniref:type II toxin-antitoxin system Phd/YefM family antitoxin n=2 Tax=Roseobacteraceae TaxID=2854170 RepID=UPI003A85FD18
LTCTEFCAYMYVTRSEAPMDVITYTDARASLKDVMDRVIHDNVDVVVTRKKREAVVMMSLDEYNAIQETLHLQRSPANARRLQSSIAQLDAGNGTERDIDL